MSVIVCATDLSAESTAVVSKAAEMSKLLGLPLQLFHVFDLPFSPEVLDEISDNLRRGAEAKIASQAEPLRARAVAVRTCVQLGVKDDIVRHARAVDAQLLVLGTHARKGTARFFLGSVAEHAIRTSPCPVLVIPPATQAHPAKTRPDAPLEIVVGIDFSPASDAALAWLRSLLEHVSCNVRLVHLYSPAREHERLGFAPPMPFEINSEVVTTLARDLRAHVHAQAGTDFALHVRPSWGGEEDPLAWEAETDGADLLLIGTSQTRRSTALATVRGAHLPVLCVPNHHSDAKPEPVAPVRTVLALTDFSPAGNAAIPQAYRLLMASGGDVVLAHVARPDGLGLAPTREEEIENCLLALVPEDIDRAGIRTRTFVTADIVPSEAILKAIRRFAPDLVVMASRGGTAAAHPGGRGMTTEDLVWNSPKPVVVVPGSRSFA
jgi:nucleotide-binding universal stress UspA family protein